MRRPTAVILIVTALATGAKAQTNLVIDSLSDDGTLTWSRPTNDVVKYNIEWAPTAGGPWTSSWSKLSDIAPTGATMSARVPFCYRVVAQLTAPPPAGMATVPQGSFAMGDTYSEGSENERPVHTVTLSAFWIDQREVSKSLWDSVRTWGLAHGYTDIAVGQGGVRSNQVQGVNHPVIMVNWYDCAKWCNARSEMSGLTPAYYTNSARTAVYRLGDVPIQTTWVTWTNDGYRLPTEAEWEKAARGGLTGHHFPWPSLGGTYADHISGEKANYWDSGDPWENGTTPVGYYHGTQSPAGGDMANGYGLYDMAGNVDEWCWDRYLSTYPSGATTNPKGPDTGSARVFRGGSWSNYGTSSLRCARRDYFFVPGAEQQYEFLGFRTVRTKPN